MVLNEPETHSQVSLEIQDENDAVLPRLWIYLLSSQMIEWNSREISNS